MKARLGKRAAKERDPTSAADYIQNGWRRGILKTVNESVSGLSRVVSGGEAVLEINTPKSWRPRAGRHIGL
jgi:hypothetical protein